MNNGTTLESPFFSFEKGILMLNSGDVLMISAGVYNLKNTTSLRDLENVVVMGSSQPEYPFNRTVISITTEVIKSAESRIRPTILINNCQNITISNLDITGSFSTRYNTDQHEGLKDVSQGSAMKINNCSDIHVNSVLFKENIAHWGGAVYILRSNNVNFGFCNFEENRAITINTYFDRVISQLQNYHSISGKFYSNSPVAQRSVQNALGFGGQSYIENGFGGAVYIIDSENVTIASSKFKKNSAGTGGALYLRNIHNISIFESFFEANRVTDDGTVLYFKNVTNPESSKDFISDCVFYDNHCSGKLQCKIIFWDDMIPWTDHQNLWASIPLIVLMALPAWMVVLTVVWGLIHGYHLCNCFAHMPMNMELKSSLIDRLGIAYYKSGIIRKFQELEYTYQKILIWWFNTLGLNFYVFSSKFDVFLFIGHKIVFVGTIIACFLIVIFRVILGYLTVYSYDDWGILFNFFDVSLTSTEITMIFGLILYISMIWNTSVFKKQLDVAFSIESLRGITWKRLLVYYLAMATFIILPFISCIASPFISLGLGGFMVGLFRYPVETRWLTILTILENFISYSLSSITLTLLFFISEKSKYVIREKFSAMKTLIENPKEENHDFGTALSHYYECIDDLNDDPTHYINVIYFVWLVALIARVVTVQVFFLRTDVGVIVGDIFWWGFVLVVQLLMGSLISQEFFTQYDEHMKYLRKNVEKYSLEKYSAYVQCMERSYWRYTFLGREMNLAFLAVVISVLLPILKIVTELSSTILQLIYRS